jgi:hypothetical protein
MSTTGGQPGSDPKVRSIDTQAERKRRRNGAMGRLDDGRAKIGKCIKD